jgi:hypothetical protein
MDNILQVVEAVFAIYFDYFAKKACIARKTG